MSRYIIFHGEKYYPSGGAKDIHSIVDTFDEAIKITEDLTDDWFHVYDMYEDRIILDSNQDGDYDAVRQDDSIFDEYKTNRLNDSVFDVFTHDGECFRLLCRVTSFHRFVDVTLNRDDDLSITCHKFPFRQLVRNGTKVSFNDIEPLYYTRCYLENKKGDKVKETDAFVILGLFNEGIISNEAR